MAYSELVKRFDLVRDYMRDFLIFGFKTREDFDRKSGRTYDNERRRIESWLGDSLRWEYRAGGKALFLSLDAGTLSRNPLYRAWQSKSFTDNDILLHFFLLDLLADGRPRHAEAITDELLEAYDQVFEPLTVRRKLKEYAQLGILHTEKQGRRLCYTRASRSLETLFPDQTNLPELLAFFGETAPLAVVGAYLAGRLPSENLTFRFKHHFIAHTLEDQILLTALQAMRRGERLAITNVSGRNSAETVCTVIPLKILVSVQTGRRYLAARRLDAPFRVFSAGLHQESGASAGRGRGRGLQNAGRAASRRILGSGHSGPQPAAAVFHDSGRGRGTGAVYSSAPAAGGTGRNRGTDRPGPLALYHAGFRHGRDDELGQNLYRADRRARGRRSGGGPAVS